VASGEAGAAACHTAALRILARREISEQDLRRRLRRQQFPAADIDTAVSRLLASGALDDRRVAFAFARTRLTVKRHGRARVERELEAMGVARDLAREAVAVTFADTDEREAIAKAIQRRRRAGRPVDAAERRRLQAYLIRQGFSPDAVIQALKAHSNDPDTD
jgi:regulatory protein